MSDSKPTQVYYHEGNVTREDRAKALGQTGATLWFTGLSGSGKSTLALALEQELIRMGRAAYSLDGDNVRFGLNAAPKILMDKRGYSETDARRFGLGFDAIDRVENIRRIGEVAKLFTDAGLLTLASFISPYRKDRDAVRTIHAENITGGLRFIEVYVNTPIEACERRDPKGLYKQARTAVANGKGMGFTGVDDPYEPPLKPELTFDAAARTVQDGVAMIVSYLKAEKLVA